MFKLSKFKLSNCQIFKLSNVHMSSVKCQMSNINKVKLLSERTSGVAPVIFLKARVACASKNPYNEIFSVLLKSLKLLLK